MEGAVSERRKAFATAHRSDEDHQAYISASRQALSVIVKAKAEARQTTCSSLSPKSNPKSVYSVLRSIAGSPSSSSSSLNFPQQFFSQGVGFGLRRLPEISLFHFSAKDLRSRARSYLTELRRATYPEELHSSFCTPFSPTELLGAASNLSPFTATGPEKIAYSMLKRLPRSGMDFFLHIFNLS